MATLIENLFTNAGKVIFDTLEALYGALNGGITTLSSDVFN
ncbi:hypothetical protein CATRI_00740 [Corynebacterium atrinae]|nr:hypothetical protein [Corynebacterium atrinae]WJY62270.1 hypothetical protein CATRI_00740 [Corynebacterium atrinae]